jgi:hypothetical protein
MDVGEQRSQTPSIELKEGDYIFNRTLKDPIPTGGAVDGAIVFFVPGYPRDRVNDPSTVLTISCQDVNSVSYSKEYPIPVKSWVFTERPGQQQVPPTQEQ